MSTNEDLKAIIPATGNWYVVTPVVKDCEGWVFDSFSYHEVIAWAVTWLNPETQDRMQFSHPITADDLSDLDCCLILQTPRMSMVEPGNGEFASEALVIERFKQDAERRRRRRKDDA